MYHHGAKSVQHWWVVWMTGRGCYYCLKYRKPYGANNSLGFGKNWTSTGNEGWDGHFDQFSEFRFSQGLDIKCIIWPNLKDQNEWCFQIKKRKRQNLFFPSTPFRCLQVCRQNSKNSKKNSWWWWHGAGEGVTMLNHTQSNSLAGLQPLLIDTDIQFLLYCN